MKISIVIPLFVLLTACAGPALMSHQPAPTPLTIPAVPAASTNAQTFFLENDLEVGAGDSNVVYHDGYLYHAHSGALWVFDAVTGEDVHMQLAPDKSYIRKVGKSSNRIFVQSYSHWSCYMPYDSSVVVEGG